MILKRVAVAASLSGWALLAGCNKSGGSGTSGAAPGKDSEVRTYINGPLALYLDSLTREVCRIKRAVASGVGPGNDICKPEPDGYKKPPTNGAP